MISENQMIHDRETYEFGILTGESRAAAHADAAEFARAKYGAWMGGSQSWSGDRFRAGDRRRIKTWQDYMRYNPHGMPTDKTFTFYRVIVEDGRRMREQVAEGTFLPPPPPKAKPISPALSDDGSVPAAVPMAAAMSHPQSSESRTLREVLERTCEQYRSDLARAREENQRLTDQLHAAQAEVASNRQKIISIDADRVRYQAELEAQKRAHEAEIDAINDDCDREIDALKDQHARELEDARRSAAQETRQQLSDGINPMQKLVRAIGDNAHRIPEVLDMISQVRQMVSAASGMPQQQQMQQQQPQVIPNPYEDRSSPYTTAVEPQI